MKIQAANIVLHIAHYFFLPCLYIYIYIHIYVHMYVYTHEEITYIYFNLLYF